MKVSVLLKKNSSKNPADEWELKSQRDIDIDDFERAVLYRSKGLKEDALITLVLAWNSSYSYKVNYITTLRLLTDICEQDQVTKAFELVRK